MELANCFPEQFSAGNSIEYRRALLWAGGFSPADGWSLKLYLRGKTLPVGNAFIAGISGVADGDSWIVTVPAAATADLVPGTYTWVERVTDGTRVIDASSGATAVLANIGTVTTLAQFDEDQLAAVRERISARLARDVTRMSAFDRAIEHEALKDLREIETDLLNRIEARRRGSTQRAPIRAAFTRL